MATEIDLVTVKALIDRALFLKEETQTLAQQLKESQAEREKLKQQLLAQQDTLKSQHEKLSQQLADGEDSHKAALVALEQKHNAELEAQVQAMQSQIEKITQSHEDTLAATVQKMSKKNIELSEALTYSEQQNKAFANRIKGLK